MDDLREMRCTRMQALRLHTTTALGARLDRSTVIVFDAAGSAACSFKMARWSQQKGP